MTNKSLLLALTLLAPSALQAQGPGGPGGAPQPPRPVVLALDTDKNGILSAEEIAAAAKTLLVLDVNHDGKLTFEEFTQRQALNEPPSNDELLTRLMTFDKNGDGILTKDEMPERMQGMFERGDTDKDGKLTAAEIKALSAAQPVPVGRIRTDATRQDAVLRVLDSDQDGVISAAEIAAAPTTLKALDKNGDGQITPNELAPPTATAESRAEHLFDEWDTNKDGKLTKPELPDRMQPMFESLDKNGDGYLDKNEVTLYFSTMPPQNGRQEGPRPQ